MKRTKNTNGTLYEHVNLNTEEIHLLWAKANGKLDVITEALTHLYNFQKDTFKRADFTEEQQTELLDGIRALNRIVYANAFEINDLWNKKVEKRLEFFKDASELILL